MEGRKTTPPTTSGVQKPAGQSKAEVISKPNIARPYTSQNVWYQLLLVKLGYVTAATAASHSD
jgi:hypothetical protein